MNFQRIRSVFQCEIEILTPVHIGNGEKYINNFDFLYEQKKIKVFDHERLFAMVGKLDRDSIYSFAAAVEEGELGRWLRENKLNINDTVIHSFNWSDHKIPVEINRQIRDGFGRPTIPGSSLKGVFRTAIMTRMTKEDKTDIVGKTLRDLMAQPKVVRPQFADSDLCRNLLGDDPKTNLMRALTVADFTFDQKNVQVQNAYVTRLTNASVFKRKPWNILVEKLNQGASALGQISFDDFLLAQDRDQKPFHFKIKIALPWLLQALQARTQKTIDNELDFFSNKSGDGVDALKNFYTKLKSDHARLEENEAIVRFAWGSGWDGMTGGLLENRLLTPDVRQKLNLARKYTEFPFPKSRRLAVTGDSMLPMGWIRLKFTSKDMIRQSEEIKLNNLKQERQKEAEKAKEVVMWLSMSAEDQDLAIVRGEAIALSQAPGIDPLQAIWPKVEQADPGHRKALALAFKERWQRDKKWAKKNCSKKQWEKVKRIEKILGES